jgi:hypothetical protein
MKEVLKMEENMNIGQNEPVNANVSNEAPIEAPKPLSVPTIHRFDGKLEAKLIKAFGDIFDEPIDDDRVNEENVLNGDIQAICVDDAHVCMCQAKTEEAKRFMTRFISKTKQPKKPTLTYPDSGKTIVRVNTTYMHRIMAFFDCFSEKKAGPHVGNGVTLTSGTDYPLQMENVHFEFLLAPRIETD